MIALDTNVLARFFVEDSDDVEAVKQRPVAEAAMKDRSYVSITVLLEFAWVLTGFYDFPRAEVSRILRALASLEHIVIEDRAAALAALDAFDNGFDFADALHVARGSQATVFRTFDKRLAKAAKRAGWAVAVEALG